jgi:hypothetical protein
LLLDGNASLPAWTGPLAHGYRHTCINRRRLDADVLLVKLLLLFTRRRWRRNIKEMGGGMFRALCVFLLLLQFLLFSGAGGRWVEWGYGVARPHI